MPKTIYTGRCKKIKLAKCIGLATVLDSIAEQYAYRLECDQNVESYRCCVPLADVRVVFRNYDGVPLSSDFVIYYKDGHTAIRECHYQKSLENHRVVGWLNLSMKYWQTKGVWDWTVITDCNIQKGAVYGE